MNNMRETQEVVLFPIKYYQRFLAIHVINKNVVVHEETWGHMTNIICTGARVTNQSHSEETNMRHHQAY